VNRQKFELSKSFTGLLLAINIGVFFFIPLDRARVDYAFRLSDKYELWRWLTHMFVHGSSTHILCNMITLHSFGPPTEQTLGRKRYIWVYFASGLAALLAQVLTHPQDNNWLVGASGAIGGVIGAMCYLQPQAKLLLFFALPVKQIRAFYIIIIASIAFAIFGILPYIAHMAHVGGLACGFLMTKYIFKIPPASPVRMLDHRTFEMKEG